jgi:hypothetical protein
MCLIIADVEWFSWKKKLESLFNCFGEWDVEKSKKIKIEIKRKNVFLFLFVSVFVYKLI